MSKCRVCEKELTTGDMKLDICNKCEEGYQLELYRRGKTRCIGLCPERYKHILLVEDGSVDYENLKDLAGAGVKVIVYRQGANIPQLLNLDDTSCEWINQGGSL